MPTLQKLGRASCLLRQGDVDCQAVLLLLRHPQCENCISLCQFASLCHRCMGKGATWRLCARPGADSCAAQSRTLLPAGAAAASPLPAQKVGVEEQQCSIDHTVLFASMENVVQERGGIGNQYMEESGVCMNRLPC